MTLSLFTQRPTWTHAGKESSCQHKIVQIFVPVYELIIESIYMAVAARNSCRHKFPTGMKDRYEISCWHKLM